MDSENSNWIYSWFVSPLNLPARIWWHYFINQLTLQAPIPQNGQTHSNNSSANCRRIVWACLTISWYWRLKLYVYTRHGMCMLDNMLVNNNEDEYIILLTKVRASNYSFLTFTNSHFSGQTGNWCQYQILTLFFHIAMWNLKKSNNGYACF